MDKPQGWFAVEIRKHGGRLVAEPTGDHYSSDEAGVAMAIAGMDGKTSVVEGGSPVFLVKDSVAAVAIGAAKRALRAGLSECQDGPRGEPCGRCETCRRAKMDAWTSTILAGITLPDTGVSEKLREAVASVIGMTWADAPWNEAMSDEEAKALLEEYEEMKGDQE